MASATELFKAWKEGFDNKDSSKLAELLTDDFQMVSRPGTRSKQETLDWAAVNDPDIDYWIGYQGFFETLEEVATFAKGLSE